MKTENKYRGRTIYNPSGKAGEYSYWAANFYNGCSSDCEYCYCKRGALKSVWNTTPVLKKSLVNHSRAMDIFNHEVGNNLDELREHGLFFNFTSDPFLRETIDLNYSAMDFCDFMGIPVKSLTKQVWWYPEYRLPDCVTPGFTLTGFDDKEPGAASTDDRINLMDKLSWDYPVWASIEPVIELSTSLGVIMKISPFIKHMKIGPLSGKKFDSTQVLRFMEKVERYIGPSTTIYWKEGFVEKLGINRTDIPCRNSVTRDYKWWKP